MEIAILLYLVMLGIWDYKNRSVPVLLLIAGGVLMLGMCIFQYVGGQLSCMEILQGIVPGLFTLFLAWITGKVGYADGIVLVQMGCCMGYRRGMILFCASMMLLSLYCLVLICFKKIGKNTKIPYFPFLALSYVFQGL